MESLRAIQERLGSGSGSYHCPRGLVILSQASVQGALPRIEAEKKLMNFFSGRLVILVIPVIVSSSRAHKYLAPFGAPRLLCRAAPGFNPSGAQFNPGARPVSSRAAPGLIPKLARLNPERHLV